MHVFWLVLTYDLLEDRSIDDVIIKTFFSVYFNSLLYKTNRFQVAVRLFSNRSQRMSKCGFFVISLCLYKFLFRINSFTPNVLVANLLNVCLTILSKNLRS